MPQPGHKTEEEEEDGDIKVKSEGLRGEINRRPSSWTFGGSARGPSASKRRCRRPV